MKKLSHKEKIQLWKKLHALLAAHIPFDRALTILIDQYSKTPFMNRLESVNKDISSGKSISESLFISGLCTTYELSLIRIGEETRNLQQSIHFLITYHEKLNELKSKVVGVCLYPAIIGLFMFGLIIFLVMIIFPKIVPMFKSMKVTLPISTKIMIGISDLLSHHYVYVISGTLVMLVFGYTTFTKSKVVKKHLSLIPFCIPYIKQMMHLYVYASWSRTIGILLASGVTAPLSFSIAAETISFSKIKKLSISISEHITDGGLITHLLKKENQTLQLLSGLVGVGEETGTLAHSFIYAADIYENECSEAVKRLSSLIEPLLMIFLGGIVVFIAMAILGPIYQMTSVMNH